MEEEREEIMVFRVWYGVWEENGEGEHRSGEKVRRRLRIRKRGMEERIVSRIR